MKFNLTNSVSRLFHQTGFQLKKHSPEILIAAGVVGTVASAVMACKATLKVNAVLEPAKEDIEKIHEAKETGVTAAGEEYTEKDAHNDTLAVYVQTGVKIANLYAPAILLGTLSIGGIVASNGIMRKRNIALAAAYTAVDTGFKEYRGRVVDRFGKELDRELRYNIRAKEVEEVVVNEDGTEEIVKTSVDVVDPKDISMFSRFYDDGCIGWQKDAEANLMTLRGMERYANDMLEAYGVVSLNDVYKMLGFPVTRAGQTVGWSYDKANPRKINFGIYDMHNGRKRAFVNGHERVILLEFNVDGPILNKIKTKE